ncbi:ribosomal protein L7/L12 [Inquilinus ginsengisoli]|uniref:ribosomal protein L7/L12 n=1 Tax=Inquilinus ginsengisoli TaxID=363840 RepID=UPI003D230F7F
MAQNASNRPVADQDPIQTAFDVILVEVGPNSVGAIKAVREITGLTLKEATKLVESLPRTIREQISKADAEEVKEKFESAGATVKLQ